MRLVTQTEARSLFGGAGTLLQEIVERIATPRVAPVPQALPEALAPSPELEAWTDLYARHEIEVVDPGEVELRAPTAFDSWDRLLDDGCASWIADTVGVFTGATTIAQQDAMCFVASWAGTKDGASRVFYFHPHDWGLWPTDASIAGRLFRIVQEEDRPDMSWIRYEGEAEARLFSALKLYEASAERTALPSVHDPARWHRRSEWLITALTGYGRSLAASMERAAPLASFLDETEHLGRVPHVALYWLWSHFFADNRHELEVTLSLTEPCQAELVAATRAWMTDWIGGRARRLAGWEPSQLAGLVERVSALAPVQLFGPDRRRTVIASRSAAIDAREADVRLRAPLEEAVRTEPDVQRVLGLLDHLSRGGAVPPGPGPRGEDPVRAMETVADLIDDRFEPWVLRRLERAALYNDGHQEASWGLVLAWSALAKSFDRFERELARIGTDRFGPRRKAELYRAYGRFTDSRATERLHRAARRWLAEVDDWIRMEPVEAVEQLLARDALETHEFIANLLESASFSFANVSVCVEAARAAGRLRSKRAVPGLRRAVRERLGRIGDGGRADVCSALYTVEGREAFSGFEGPVEQARRCWEGAADEDDGWSHQQDLGCLMAGALPSAPEHRPWVELTEALIREVGVRLLPTRRPGPETVAVARALVQAVRRAEHVGLARQLGRWKGEGRYPSLAAELERLRSEM